MTGGTTPPILATSALEVRYGAAMALQDVTLSVSAGSVLTLLGVNGAGKSSLARACSGLIPSTSGTVTLAGQDVTSWPAHRIRREGLVYLPEGRGIFPNLSVSENLRLAVKLLEGRRQRAEAIEQACTLFPVLGSRRNQRSGSLSGGEQQMLSLARALVVGPKVVIVDEPSLGLSPLLVDSVFQSLAQAKALGITMVLIEQFAHRALALSDHCVILRRGRVAWSGKAEEADEQVTAKYFGGDAAVAGDVRSPVPATGP